VRCTLTPPRVHGGYKYCGALHLNASSGARPTNIAVRYKYCGALHLNASSGARPTNIAVRYKYFGALHLNASSGTRPTNISVRCSLAPAWCARWLQRLRCDAPWRLLGCTVLQILRWDAPWRLPGVHGPTNIAVRCTL
jgi:hypothetical protein